jgi:hypothetical protein
MAHDLEGACYKMRAYPIVLALSNAVYYWKRQIHRYYG